MEKNSIVIKGANEHNLKNVDLKIPRDKLIVFTGFFSFRSTGGRKVYKGECTGSKQFKKICDSKPFKRRFYQKE